MFPDPDCCINFENCENRFLPGCPTDCHKFTVTLFDELTARADFHGYESLTEKEQAYIFGFITLDQFEKDEF